MFIIHAYLEDSEKQTRNVPTAHTYGAIRETRSTIFRPIPTHRLLAEKHSFQKRDQVKTQSRLPAYHHLQRLVLGKTISHKNVVSTINKNDNWSE